MIEISVVICTYNRSYLLKACLDSLCCQSTDSSTYEVIIINNNSSDNTEEFVKRYIMDRPNFIYIKEREQGLSYARNRGYREAKGLYVAYVDDDARVDKRWVENILDAFKSVNPQPVVVGGKITPWYEKSPPDWFSDDLEIRTWGEKKGFLNSTKAKYGFSGSNMAFRKSILELYGGFTSTYGMSGKKMGYGEETALFYRLYDDHPLFWYNPEIRVEHWVPEENMRIFYHLKRAYITGISTASIQEGRSLYSIFIILLSIVKKIFILPISMQWRKSKWKKSFLEHSKPIAGSLGLIKFTLLGK